MSWKLVVNLKGVEGGREGKRMLDGERKRRWEWGLEEDEICNQTNRLSEISFSMIDKTFLITRSFFQASKPCSLCSILWHLDLSAQNACLSCRKIFIWTSIIPWSISTCLKKQKYPQTTVTSIFRIPDHQNHHDPKTSPAAPPCAAPITPQGSDDGDGKKRRSCSISTLKLIW